MSGREEEVYYNYAKYLNLFYSCNSFVFHQQPKSEAVAIWFSVMMSTFFIEKRSRGERQIFRKAAVVYIRNFSRHRENRAGLSG